MEICVIGSGYVGLVTGTCFADFGVNVTCVDNDKSKIDMLLEGEIPIYEPGLKELVEKNVGEGRLSFTTDLKAAVERSKVIFIAVGTPPGEDGSADLSYVKAVASEIAAHLNDYKVIVTKSTVPVGTGTIIDEIVTKEKKGGVEFDVASNPEFLREGSAIEDFMRPNRVVLGTRSERATEVLKELYSPLYLLETPFVITNVETSELIKYASNAFLATKISFINEMANICELVGGDVGMVSKGMGLDNRIGSKFLHPGPGYGGSCFPKDTLAITKIANDHGYSFRIVDTVVEVNKGQRDKMVEKIKNLMGAIEGKTFGVLGLTFKPNTDDIRESPALDIAERLLEGGATLNVYDPVGMANSRTVLGDRVKYCEDTYEALEGADGLILLTEWNQFRSLDLERVKSLLKEPNFVDLRNVYEPHHMKEEGFNYISVGR